MRTFMPGTWWGILALASALVGCSGDKEGAAPDGGADVTRCNGLTATISCCEHDCDNDVFIDALCVNDAWVCPADYVSSAYCPAYRFCQGPLPGPRDAGTGNPCDDINPGFTCCVAECTNHVTTSPFCDASGWHCPAGSVSPEDCPGQPFCLGQ
jgi:hypothetical protein